MNNELKQEFMDEICRRVDQTVLKHCKDEGYHLNVVPGLFSQQDLDGYRLTVNEKHSFVVMEAPGEVIGDTMLKVVMAVMELIRTKYKKGSEIFYEHKGKCSNKGYSMNRVWIVGGEKQKYVLDFVDEYT